jgi:hypothetical protein
MLATAPATRYNGRKPRAALARGKLFPGLVPTAGEIG